MTPLNFACPHCLAAPLEPCREPRGDCPSQGFRDRKTPHSARVDTMEGFRADLRAGNGPLAKERQETAKVRKRVMELEAQLREEQAEVTRWRKATTEARISCATAEDELFQRREEIGRAAIAGEQREKKIKELQEEVDRLRHKLSTAVSVLGVNSGASMVASRATARIKRLEELLRSVAFTLQGRPHDHPDLCAIIDEELSNG